MTDELFEQFSKTIRAYNDKPDQTSIDEKARELAISSVNFFLSDNSAAAEHKFKDLFAFYLADFWKRGFEVGKNSQQSNDVRENGAMMPPLPTPPPDMSVHITTTPTATQILMEIIAELDADIATYKPKSEYSSRALAALGYMLTFKKRIQSKLTALQTPQEPTEQP